MCGIFAYLGADLSLGQLMPSFNKIQDRGPDFSTLKRVGPRHWLGFHRLAIMDPSPAGNQPFELDGATLVCNGEIYNYRALAEEYELQLKTGSDCEVILHLYKKLGVEETVKQLDGVFAFVIVDGEEVFAARDPLGVRPLFWGTATEKEGRLARFACSEMKGIHDLCETVQPFPPGCWAALHDEGSQAVPFYQYDYPQATDQDERYWMAVIRERLIEAVDKRLMSDRPLGCLVSGGVDSSLVAALVARHYPEGQLHTFTVGLETGASDMGYARMVADFIGSDHHELFLSKAEALALLEETVRVCESWDTTTIRASSMQLALSKYIAANTDIKVVFNGDVIDEASGSYVYFKNAPSELAYQEETVRLMKEIHLFDVLRTDRTVSGCGLEARLPFGDLDFVRMYMSIPARLRQPRNGVEKFLLRKAFDGYLPDAVLWRPKEAFSDGCSQPEESWYTIIQAFVEELVTDEELHAVTTRHGTPLTKEQVYYRRTFDRLYPGREEVIPHFWLPRWCGDVIDPSARVLQDVYRPSSDTITKTQARMEPLARRKMHKLTG
jgi:asparagine synthase (glutamine-hydrolysing)